MPDDQKQLSGAHIVLTGATGFIGQRVLSLLLSHGAKVTAVVRSSRSARRTVATGVSVVVADLADTATMSGILRGTDRLVHLAYDIRRGSRENLATFDGLLRAAEEANISQIVHASSVVVYRDWLQGDINENSTISKPHGGPYLQAKIRMEERLAERGLNAAILQPTLVYGPGSAIWTDRLSVALARGGIILPEPQGICNTVYVDDVAAAVCCALAKGTEGAERFLISGPEPVAWTELLEGYSRFVGGTLLREPAERIRERLGREWEHSETLPLAARISAVGRSLIGNDRFEAMTGLLRCGATDALLPDHHLFGVFTCKGVVSIEKAKRQLGYNPLFDLEKGLVATGPYLRQKFQ